MARSTRRHAPVFVTGAAAAVLLLGTFGCTASNHAAESATADPAADSGRAREFLYGRVVTADDQVYEGRLRWGGDQEAFWTDYFDGVKKTNRWAAHAATLSRQEARRPLEIFGFSIGGRAPDAELARPFMTRFGEIARLDASFGEVQVTLKSGSAVVLNRFEAGDIDDGVRVWDARRGEVSLDARQIRSVEFAPAQPTAVPERLHGTVRTRDGEFTGFVQWDRRHYLATDALSARTPDQEVQVRFDTLRSIARESRDSARVTRLDGTDMVLSGTGEVDSRIRGIAVDDARYGRVVIGWSEFVRVDFSRAAVGPAYEDFPPGRPLAGTVTTRDGRRLAGRLVYDFDESESTDTFDVTSQERVGYTLPLALVASIVVPRPDQNGAPPVTVLLRDGRALRVERTGDLGDRNAGLLVFAGGGEPAHVPWSDVAEIAFDAPPAPTAH